GEKAARRWKFRIKHRHVTRASRFFSKSLRGLAVNGGVPEERDGARDDSVNSFYLETPMHVAYATTDAVHEDLALEVAGAFGILVYPVSPQDIPLNGWFDAVLYDLDFLSARQRQEILTALASGASACPAAVHSYNLDEDLPRALRRRGVLVADRLDEC